MGGPAVRLAFAIAFCVVVVLVALTCAMRAGGLLSWRESIAITGIAAGVTAAVVGFVFFCVVVVGGAPL